MGRVIDRIYSPYSSYALEVRFDGSSSHPPRSYGRDRTGVERSEPVGGIAQEEEKNSRVRTISELTFLLPV